MNGGLKALAADNEKFHDFGVPAAPGWWHMEPSRRIFSEHIKDPELALCTNYTSMGFPAANESHIQFYLTGFEKILIMHPNCLSGSPHDSGQFTLQGYYLQRLPLQVITDLKIARSRSTPGILNGGLKALAAEK